MNNKYNVWQRILDCSTNNSEKPTDDTVIFETKARHIKFWIYKINENTILPFNENGSKLYRISKAVIEEDIDNNRGGNVDLRAKDYKSPAPSYRLSLLNDPRIWLKNK